MRHLALQFYDIAGRREKDRRSVDFETVLADVKTVLPSVDLDPARDAQPLLTEIVERSGLLLPIDGGQRYQFAHLTVQEYFAAEALLGDEETLFGQFQDDRDAWREVVKLWCGLANDSSGLIERVREVDPITAFECLGAAQRVESALLDQLLDEFQSKLSEGDKVIEGFASVASDPQGRGAKVLEFLKGTLTDDADQGRRLAAAAALASTNLPEAAGALAAACDELPDAIRHLSSMGDLAVSPLGERIQQADTQTEEGLAVAIAAMDQLEAIATPLAAATLTPFLWGPNQTLATKAAWRLARMLRNPRIEEALRAPARWDRTWTTEHPWVWEPFGAPPGSPLSSITGRIAELLSAVGPTPEEVRRAPLDERLTVPLATGLGAGDREGAFGGGRVDWLAALPTEVREGWTKGLRAIGGAGMPGALWR